MLKMGLKKGDMKNRISDEEDGRPQGLDTYKQCSLFVVFICFFRY